MTKAIRIAKVIKKSSVAKTILKRIEEEYEVVLKFLMSSSDPVIGFWTSVRMIMPLVEIAGKLEKKLPYELLATLGVPKAEIAWTMFRNGLSHSEIPFSVEDIDGKRYEWSISFDFTRHTVSKKDSNPIWIVMSVPLLLKDLKKYLERFIDDETFVSIQVGTRFENIPKPK